MKNQKYASVDLLIANGVGKDAKEVCRNLVGKVDQIGGHTADVSEWEDIPRVRITKARVRHDSPDQFPDGYVYVDYQSA